MSKHETIRKVLSLDINLEDEALDHLTKEGMWRFTLCSIIAIPTGVLSDHKGFLVAGYVFIAIAVLNYLPRFILKRKEAK
jgi:hypothetical protein